MQGTSEALAGFLKRLMFHSVLYDEEQRAVLSLDAREIHVPGRKDLVDPGDMVDHAILVGEGILGRFDLMRNGARQITAFYIAGDMCDLHSVVSPSTGWGITTLSASTVFHIAHSELKGLATIYPNIALAFWRDTALDASILAKWIANLGRKDARARVAHLLCELGVRSERVGLGQRSDYPLEATQEQIGDAVGLTSVHVNRTLQALRKDGLVAVRSGRVEILDWDGLAAAAEFVSTFLLRGASECSSRATKAPVS